MQHCDVLLRSAVRDESLELRLASYPATHNLVTHRQNFEIEEPVVSRH